MLPIGVSTFLGRIVEPESTPPLQHYFPLFDILLKNSESGKLVQARNSMRQQRPIVVVACHDWELPKYLQDAEENGHVVIIR